VAVTAGKATGDGLACPVHAPGPAAALLAFLLVTGGAPARAAEVGRFRDTRLRLAGRVTEALRVVG